MAQDQASYTFLLAAGASRQDQYDDFWKVIVDKKTDQVTAVSLKVKEMDGFGGRHSLSAATLNGKTILFGGQDVMQDKVLNELFVYHHDKNELEKIEYLKDGVIVPKPRNSHSFT